MLGRSKHHQGGVLEAMAIRCPSCNYSLRGLPGVVVTCPECGEPCDLPEIIRRRRIDRWRNPEYRVLSAPAATFTVGMVVWLLFSGLLGRRADLSAVAVAGLVVLAVWILRLAASIFQRADPEALRLIMLLHLVYVGFPVLVVGGFGVFIGKLVSMVDAIDARNLDLALGQGVLAAAAGMVSLGSAPLLRWIDRSVGRVCIRRLIERDRTAY